MEQEKKISALLDQIPQPGFLVQGNQIRAVNPAAAALLLEPGQDFPTMIHTGRQDYTAFSQGQLSLTLTMGGQFCNAVIHRMEDLDLVLLEADSAMDEFRSMALVSMELRQPLMQAILSAGQLADPQDPAAAKINRSLMQMLRLVSNMADISRYTAASRMEVRDADSFLLELFEKAAALYGDVLELSYEGLGQPLFTRMDPEQLERAVWNILSNCLKFTPKGGTVRGRLTRQDNLLRLTVEDSGSGIAEAARATLFSRYLRQPGIEDSRFGLGLGLALVRTAAANHGGTVMISSVPEGGTRITMTLAIRQEEDAMLRSPLLRPDYTGGFDHGLVELADCLNAEIYANL